MEIVTFLTTGRRCLMSDCPGEFRGESMRPGSQEPSQFRVRSYLKAFALHWGQPTQTFCYLLFSHKKRSTQLFVSHAILLWINRSWWWSCEMVSLMTNVATLISVVSFWAPALQPVTRGHLAWVGFSDKCNSPLHEIPLCHKIWIQFKL